MTDIELVIRISEEDYKTLVNINDSRLPSIIARKHLFNAIAIGTPLPKGHGDLVDRNDLKYDKYNSYAYAIANAPTIIKADKGE